MRILHLSAYDLMGGAAKAAFRLHRALVEADEESLMLVRRKDSDRADVIGPEGWLRRAATKLQRRAESVLVVPRAKDEFSVGSLPDGLLSRVKALRPDIVHVHWVSHGFLRLETLAQLGVPVVWTMHDMWAFTGGCHYSGECERFRYGCGRCPLLDRPAEEDVSREGVLRRQRLSATVNLALVAPSEWLAGCARGSAAMGAVKVRVIPNTVDTAVFSPRDRLAARRRSGLPETGPILLAGAMDVGRIARKGSDQFDRMLIALAGAETGAIRPQVAVFGTAERRVVSRHGFTLHEMGHVAGEAAMADVYASADVFVAPSRQDNLPNTVMEAMAVGTPVAGFRVGGIPDMVEDGVNGLLANQGDVLALAQAAARLLKDDTLRTEMGRAAREKVLRCYAPGVVTAAYRALYSECGGRS